MGDETRREVFLRHASAFEFGAVAVAAALIIVTPGPDTIYILARSIGQGRGAGLLSVLGIACGLAAHLCAATLGLSALLLSLPALLRVVQAVGGAYLIFLGARILLSRAPDAHLAALPTARRGQVLRQAALTNLLNPKVGLFFIAFLPQFVSPRQGNVPLQIFTLGVVFAAAGTAWNTVTALTGGAVGRFLSRNPAVARLQQRVMGAVFVALGLRMALDIF